MSEPEPLEQTIDRLWERGQEMGLDPFPVVFEEVPSSRLYDIAAYGMPAHYRHWSYGKRFHLMKRQYDAGRGRIMELVVNSNPALAYLLKNNHEVYHKMVCAHVFGHSDFFKHNMYFRPTNTDKVSIFRAHQERMASYEEEHGIERVEELIDYAHALRQHRPLTPLIAHGSMDEGPAEEDEPESGSRSALFDEYADLFPDRQESAGAATAEDDEEPPPRKDLLLYLIEESDALEDWERDVLSMVHDEQTFLLPQMVTKTMNEGWAVFWHTRLMEEVPLTEQENFLYAQSHGRVVSRNPLRLNPYLVGWKIYEDILERKGMEGCFEARDNHNDASFYRRYLRDELIDRLDLYTVQWKGDGPQPDQAVVEDKDPERVRNRLANKANHQNIPTVEVVEVEEDRTLVLSYAEDRELIEKDAKRVLHYIEQLWGHPVKLVQQDGKTLHPSTGGDRDE